MSTQLRADAVAALRLAAISSPPLTPGLLKMLEDKHFAYGFDGMRADEPFKCYQSEPLSWSRQKRRDADIGRNVKNEWRRTQAGHLRVIMGRCRYLVANERRTIDRLADAFAKMPGRYFTEPLTITVEPPALDN